MAVSAEPIRDSQTRKKGAKTPSLLQRLLLLQRNDPRIASVKAIEHQLGMRHIQNCESHEGMLIWT